MVNLLRFSFISMLEDLLLLMRFIDLVLIDDGGEVLNCIVCSLVVKLIVIIELLIYSQINIALQIIKVILCLVN